MSEEKAPRRVRYLFWLILGALSTVVPEVIAGSDLYPFFKITDYLIVIPLYTLHSLVLWYVIWTGGKPKLYNLFPAGAIFGLYEAYMTKVIWNPTWAAIPFKILGVAVVETLVLVLFWHSFLAFIVPLFVAEAALTGSREISAGIPAWLGKRITQSHDGRLFLLFPLTAGLFQGINTPTVRDAVFSGLSSTLIVMAVFMVWRRSNLGGYPMRSLLPTKGEFRVLLSLLLLMYGWMGVFWRPEALPGMGPQAAVMSLYLFFGGLLYMGIKKSRTDSSAGPVIEVNLSNRNMLIFGGVFCLSAVLGKATGLSMIAVYVVWAGGIIFGFIVLIDTVRSVLTGNLG